MWHICIMLVISDNHDTRDFHVCNTDGLHGVVACTSERPCALQQQLHRQLTTGLTSIDAGNLAFVPCFAPRSVHVHPELSCPPAAAARHSRTRTPWHSASHTVHVVHKPSYRINFFALLLS